jgi:H+/Cl- antiporter ClcA
MSGTRTPAPPPLEANDQLVTAGITAGWLIALVVLLAVRTDIPPADRWWIWTCAAGVGLGVFGLLYVPRLKRSRERAARRRTEPGPR